MRAVGGDGECRQVSQTVGQDHGQVFAHLHWACRGGLQRGGGRRGALRALGLGGPQDIPVGTHEWH